MSTFGQAPHRSRGKLVWLIISALTGLLVIPIALAAPAEPFRISGCSTYQGITHCQESWGMAMQIDINPAGNARLVSNFQSRYEVYEDGVLVRSGVQKNHVFGQYMFITDPAYSDPHINHPRFRDSYTLPDGTSCTFVYEVMYINNQVVHETDEFSCD